MTDVYNKLLVVLEHGSKDLLRTNYCALRNVREFEETQPLLTSSDKDRRMMRQDIRYSVRTNYHMNRNRLNAHLPFYFDKLVIFEKFKS